MELTTSNYQQFRTVFWLSFVLTILAPISNVDANISQPASASSISWSPLYKQSVSAHYHERPLRPRYFRAKNVISEHSPSSLATQMGLTPSLRTAYVSPSSPLSNTTISYQTSPSYTAVQSSSQKCCNAFHLTFQGNNPDNGLVALITGGSRGIGKSIVDRLACGGIKHILIVARGQQACDDTANELIGRGYSASAHAVDVSDGDAVNSLCESLFSKYPRIDVLVNNAGITRDNLFLKMSKDEWEDVINTNLNSAFYFTSPIIKRMSKNKFGRIINMSSVVGVGGNAGQANYSASKAGLIGMTRTLGKEYANRGITVNAIAPGFIVSEMTKKMPQKAIEQIMTRIPMGRFGTPDEVADLAAFLASDQSSYITGKVFPIDGGMLFGGN